MDSGVRRVMLASGAYAALLLVSFVVRHIGTRDEDVPPPLIGSGTNGGAREVSVRQEAHEGSVLAVKEDVRIAYSEFVPASDAAMPVLMIHGSPGHRQDFAQLGPLLAERWRVIAPDLPGFGDSTHSLSDYSFRAHARYMLAMMDRLGIARAHLIGYSMGGGVVLNMIDLAPQRVASLTMLSAIGVQEMELTGSYYVNHLVHGVQLGGLLLLREATPHMGLFDGGMLGVEYARNFYDSDQRPLRAILQHVEVPALVLHGDRDPLVPPEAAIEHHRLLPQSELTMLPSNHFMPFAQPELLAGPISAFLRRVEDGTAGTRRSADASAVEAASARFTRAPFPHVRGIAAVVTTLVIAGFAAVLPEWGAVSAGVLLGQLRVGVVIAAVGVLIGIAARWLVVAAFRRARRGWTGRPPGTRPGTVPSWRRPSAIGRRAVWLGVLIVASAAGTYALSLVK